jgi:hypothetical protein
MVQCLETPTAPCPELGLDEFWAIDRSGQNIADRKVWFSLAERSLALTDELVDRESRSGHSAQA